MSENNIYNGTFVLGNVSATTLSAGEGIKITTDEPGVIKVSNDETVLFSNTSGGTSGQFNLSEAYTNFEKISITHGCRWNPAGRTFSQDAVFDTSLFSKYNGASIISTDMDATQVEGLEGAGMHFTTTLISAVNSTALYMGPSRVTFITAANPTTGNKATEDSRFVYKIVGINRKQNGGN